MIRAGLIGLEFWDPSSSKWGQPHMQARFAIMKQLHKANVLNLNIQTQIILIWKLWLTKLN